MFHEYSRKNLYDVTTDNFIAPVVSLRESSFLGFFKKYNVHVVSSMPHWTRGKTDKQRGDGVFDKSIKALQELNAVGYGMPDGRLKLDLVYNPSGAFLPGDQAAMEKDFKKVMYILKF